MSKDIHLQDVTYRTLGYANILHRPKISFQISVDRGQFVSNLEAFYDNWRDEQKGADEQFGVSEEVAYLNKLGYPSLPEFLEHREEFSDYLFNYGRDAFLELYAHADDRDARWCINEILNVEIGEDKVNILAVVFRMAEVGNMVAFPEIIVDGTLGLGMRILSALHASMAWHLGRPESIAIYEDIQFPSSAFTEVHENGLLEITEGVVLRLTEGSLGNQPTALVKLPEDYEEQFSPRFPSNPSGQQGLKMYVLVKDGMTPEQMMSLGATAVVNCYNRHHDLPKVQAWATGTFRKVVCKASASEIQAAMKSGDFVAVDSLEYGHNAAVAFAPRTDWPAVFQRLKLLR